MIRQLIVGLAILPAILAGATAHAKDRGRSRAMHHPTRVSFGRHALEPHLHGNAVVRGASLLHLAQNKGDLQAGLAALGLGEMKLPEALKVARQKMSLAQVAFDEAYRNLDRFASAAFSGTNRVHWVRAVVMKAKASARLTYLQVKAKDAGTLVTLAREAKIDLSGIKLLLPVNGSKAVLKQAERIKRDLALDPAIAGFDFLGQERRALNPKAIESAVKLLLETGRKNLVLRIHAGEGYQGKGGETNVNIALNTLAKLATTQDLKPLTIVLAHAARIDDMERARQSLTTLEERGVRVIVNVNPLSNLLTGSVHELKEIAALKLPGVRLVAGTDNVGSLRDNARLLDLMVKGDEAGAQEAASHMLHLRHHLEQEAASTQP